MNNAESLLNEKTNDLSKCQEELNRELKYSEDLKDDYCDLQNNSEIEKDSYKLQITQLNERVIIIFIM